MFIGHFEDLSSSEDSDSAPPRSRPSRNRTKGASIHDGPQAIAKFRVGGSSKQSGSVTFLGFVFLLIMCWHGRINIKFKKEMLLSALDYKNEKTLFTALDPHNLLQIQSTSYLPYKNSRLLIPLIYSHRAQCTARVHDVPWLWWTERQYLLSRCDLTHQWARCAEQQQQRSETQSSIVVCVGTLWMGGTNGILQYVPATDDSPFFDNDMPTMRSSSSSSDGLPHATGLNWEGSVESNEVSTEIKTRLSQSSDDWTRTLSRLCSFPGQDSDQCRKSSSRRMSKSHHSRCKGRHGSYDATHSSGVVNCGVRSHTGPPSSYTGPKAHKCLLFSCVWDTDWHLDGFLWSVLVWHGTNSFVSAGPGRVPGTNWLF